MCCLASASHLKGDLPLGLRLGRGHYLFVDCVDRHLGELAGGNARQVDLGQFVERLGEADIAVGLDFFHPVDGREVGGG